MYHADRKSKSSSATGAMFLLGMTLKGYFGGIKFVWMRSAERSISFNILNRIWYAL